MAKSLALASSVLCIIIVLALSSTLVDSHEHHHDEEAVHHAHHPHHKHGNRVKHEKFDVVGQVYCDPCRVQFQSELSEPISGATVKLECYNMETRAVTWSVEAETNKDGRYRIHVEGDHEEDTCEVKAIKSGREDCCDPMDEVAESRIECTNNDGMPSAVRFANPVGFMTKKIDERCMSMLRDIYKDM